MIKRANNMKKAIKPNMRGGSGQAIVTEILSSGEYAGKSRLLAVITLEPGCSIGEHVHENEEEIFYVIEGSARYDDNGTEVILNTGDSCICLADQKHSLANASETETLKVVAVILTY